MSFLLSIENNSLILTWIYPDTTLPADTIIKSKINRSLLDNVERSGSDKKLALVRHVRLLCRFDEPVKESCLLSRNIELYLSFFTNSATVSQYYARITKRYQNRKI